MANTDPLEGVTEYLGMSVSVCLGCGNRSVGMVTTLHDCGDRKMVLVSSTDFSSDKGFSRGPVLSLLSE